MKRKERWDAAPHEGENRVMVVMVLTDFPLVTGDWTGWTDAAGQPITVLILHTILFHVLSLLIFLE